MARYRQKSESDLSWNRIRRRLTRELDTQLQDWRETALNKLIAPAWDKFDALEPGQQLALESEYETWVARALSEHINLKFGDIPEAPANREAVKLEEAS